MKLNCKLQIMGLDDDLIAIPVGSDNFCGVLHINETTADILSLLENDITEEDIVDELKKQYNTTKEQLLQSVKNVIAVLQNNNLLLE